MSGIKESDPILASIAAWANDPNTSEMIRFAHGTAGGWEGWAQVEIASRLFKDHSHDFGLNQYSDIVREARIYTSSTQSAADMALYRGGRPEAGSYIIELKCESSGNSGNFATATLADLAKISVPNAFASWTKPICAWVVGLEVGRDAVAAQKLSGAGFKIYQYPSGPVRMWWLKKTW